MRCLWASWTLFCCKNQIYISSSETMYFKDAQKIKRKRKKYIARLPRMRKLKGPLGNSANEDGTDYLVLFCTLFHNMAWPLGLAMYMYFLHLPYESYSYE